MTSVTVIAVGLVLLVVSLATRNDDMVAFVAWSSGWLGALLVIVGTGKMFFLD